MRQELETIKSDVGIARVITGGMLGIVFAAVLLIGNAIAAKPAAAQEAQSIWLERTVVVERLAEHYTEMPTDLGLTSDGAVLELFATPDGATWTMVLTLPNGMSRVIATGESWIRRAPPLNGRVS